MIEVRTREEAWQEADRLFPTDYMQDDRSTANAGYPIYESTADGNYSWISDLGNRLELNIYEGKKIVTTNIWIVEKPEIIEEKRIDAKSVRECCIANELYTCGDCRAYSKMLDMADGEYSLELLYDLAKDITEHSEDQTIENVMFLLANRAVRTFFTLK